MIAANQSLWVQKNFDWYLKDFLITQYFEFHHAEVICIWKQFKNLDHFWVQIGTEIKIRVLVRIK